jgi:hypothetical protein
VWFGRARGVVCERAQSEPDRANPRGEAKPSGVSGRGEAQSEIFLACLIYVKASLDGGVDRESLFVLMHTCIWLASSMDMVTRIVAEFLPTVDVCTYPKILTLLHN